MSKKLVDVKKENHSGNVTRCARLIDDKRKLEEADLLLSVVQSLITATPDIEINKTTQMGLDVILDKARENIKAALEGH